MTRTSALFLVLILAVGAAVRLVALNETPPGFYLDESAVAVNADLIARAGIDQYGTPWPLFFRALDDYKEPLFIYSAALWVKVAGAATVVGMRAVAALWGILGLAVAWFLGREVTGDDDGAAWTALLLAVTPWHVHYSRWSEQAIVLTVVHSAAVLFLIRWVRHERRGDAAAAGLLLALGFYAYSPARLLVPLTLAAALTASVVRRRAAPPRSGLVLLAVLAVAAAPFAAYYLRHRTGMELRFNMLRLPVADVWRAFLSHLDPGFLFVHGDANPRSSAGALMPPYVLALWAAGIAFAVRERRLAPLAMGVAVLLMPGLGALTREYPHASRVITMMPFAQVLAAYGLSRAIARCPPSLQRAAVLGAVAAVAAGFLGFWAPYRDLYSLESRTAWRAGLLPALRVGQSVATPGEPIHAPAALYVDWLMLLPPDPAAVRHHAPELSRFPDELDPFDRRGRFQVLTNGARLGADEFAQWGQPGIWVVPLFAVSPVSWSRCGWRSATYCVARMP